MILCKITNAKFKGGGWLKPLMIVYDIFNYCVEIWVGWIRFHCNQSSPNQLKNIDSLRGHCQVISKLILIKNFFVEESMMVGESLQVIVYEFFYIFFKILSNTNFYLFILRKHFQASRSFNSYQNPDILVKIYGKICNGNNYDLMSKQVKIICWRLKISNIMCSIF